MNTLLCNRRVSQILGAPKTLNRFGNKNNSLYNIFNSKGGIKMRVEKEEHKNTQRFHRPKIEVPLIVITVACVFLFVTMPIWKHNTPGTLTNFEVYSMLWSDIRWAIGFQTGALVLMLGLIAARLKR